MHDEETSKDVPPWCPSYGSQRSHDGEPQYCSPAPAWRLQDVGCVMNINWKKLLFDVVKVLAGALAGSTLSGCKFALCNL